MPKESKPGSRHVYWYDVCPHHGITEHGTAWGGGCIECCKEKDAEKDNEKEDSENNL